MRGLLGHTRCVAVAGEGEDTGDAKTGVDGDITGAYSFRLVDIASAADVSAIALGARQVAVLVTDEEAPAYLAGLREQMQVAQAIVTAAELLR